MKLTHYIRIGLLFSVFFLLMFTIEAVAVEKPKAISKSPSILAKQPLAKKRADTQKKKVLFAGVGESKRKARAKVVETKKRAEAKAAKTRREAEAAAVETKKKAEAKKRKLFPANQKAGANKRQTLSTRKKGEINKKLTREKKEASKRKALRGVMQNTAAKKKKINAIRKSPGLTKKLNSKLAKPTTRIPTALDLRAREKIPQNGMPGSVDKVTKNIPVPEIGSPLGGGLSDMRGQGGTGKTRGASDPTGVIGNSMGKRGASGINMGGRELIPGMAGATTNIHSEPGMAGRGPGKVSQQSADSFGKEMKNLGLFVPPPIEPPGSPTSSAGNGMSNGDQAGTLKGLVTPKNPLEVKKQSAQAKVTRDKQKKENEEKKKKEEAEKNEEEDEEDGTEDDDDSEAAADDETQNPMEVGGERPSWMPDIGGARSSLEGANSTPADPNSPPPDEEAQQQAVDKMKAKQGELIQFGSEGGSLGGNTGSPPPTETNIGQGPECLDDDPECNNSVVNQ
jgi:hypothetical protein